jgi:HPr kinase/phosphorylase
VKSTTKILLSYFKKAPTLNLVHYARASDIIENTNNVNDIAGYLNPIHPQLVHLVSSHEIPYINSLSSLEQIEFIKKLAYNHAKYLVFNNQNNIPATFFQQDKIHLVVNDRPNSHLLQQLLDDIHQEIAERKSLHGAFVAVFGKGILITGESGSGKSNLLLSLIEKGHLWIADDAPLFFLNSRNHIIGHATENLSEFIHIKGLGPINMDKTYGQACRIHSHPLAAVVHLSDNTYIESHHISTFDQKDTLNLLNQKIPMRHFSKTNPNLSLMTENFAKHLILNNWGYNSENGLENALSNTLSTTKLTSQRQA